MLNLEQLAAGAGVTVEQKGPGHIHLRGRHLVNYYPKRPSAYISGTTGGIQDVSPAEAVELCNIVVNDPSASNSQNDSLYTRQALYATGITECWWCGSPVMPSNSVLRFKTPLSRGGLNNSTNEGLSCLECSRPNVN